LSVLETFVSPLQFVSSPEIAFFLLDRESPACKNATYTAKNIILLKIRSQSYSEVGENNESA
jgi:hypothetical protein